MKGKMKRTYKSPKVSKPNSKKAFPKMRIRNKSDELKSNQGGVLEYKEI